MDWIWSLRKGKESGILSNWRRVVSSWPWEHVGESEYETLSYEHIELEVPVRFPKGQAEWVLDMWSPRSSEYATLTYGSLVKEVGDDEKSRVEPGGKNKTTLEEVTALLMREGSSLINMQPCPVPGPAGLEGERYPGPRSLHPAQKSHLQAVLGANTWRKNTHFVRMQRSSDMEWWWGGIF